MSGRSIPATTNSTIAPFNNQRPNEVNGSQTARAPSSSSPTGIFQSSGSATQRSSQRPSSSTYQHPSASLFGDPARANADEYNFNSTAILAHPPNSSPPASSTLHGPPYSLRLPTQPFNTSATTSPAVTGLPPLSSPNGASSHTRFFYKLVAKVGPTRLVSIYDGVTDYVIGQTLRAPIKEAGLTGSNSVTPASTSRSSRGQAMTSRRFRNETFGGIFVCRTAEEALEARLPDNSALFCAPRALIKVMAWGPNIDYGNTIAFSYVRPVQVFPLSMSYLCTSFGDRLVTSVKLKETRHRLPLFHGPQKNVLRTYREREEMGALTQQIMAYDRKINQITRAQLGY